MATPNQPPPPLTLAKDHPYGAWQCCTCIEKYYNGIPDPSNEQRPWQTNQGDLVCRKCIEGLFHTAFKFDFEYPARWGGSEGIEMQIDDFAVLWPDGVFPASYKAKGVQLKLDLLKVEERTSLKICLTSNLARTSSFALSVRRHGNCGMAATT
jgi:hypothetical protein